MIERLDSHEAHTNPIGSRMEAFRSLVLQVQDCTRCSSMHHVHVLSERNGSVPSHVMFIGEAVGRLGGARTGIPMSIDATGRRFDLLLAESGINRDAVFISNAVLCNPLHNGNNRRPRRAEIVACSGFLARQIEVVDPEFVVTLGEVALSAIGEINIHGTSLRANVGDAMPWNGRTLVPLYHPGPRAVLHRPHDTQVCDWRRLGRLVLTRFPELRRQTDAP
jgi:uracil-DNA glycosylase family 4